MNVSHRQFQYLNFNNLGFDVSIIINKKLFEINGEEIINSLLKLLQRLFSSYPEFIEQKMKVKLRLLPNKEFQYGGQFEYWWKPSLKKCHININLDKLSRNPNLYYPLLVHEFTHWHDRYIAYRWNKSHLVSEKQEINLLSIILHSLRIDGLANINEFYARSNKDELFDSSAHKITKYSGNRESEFDYLNLLKNFKASLLNAKIALLQAKTSQDAEQIIFRWVIEQYNHFYFLGGLMFYLILFSNMIKMRKEDKIKIFLDKSCKKRINIRKIKHYLHRKQIYIAKVDLASFKYTFEEVKKTLPAEFFLLYLEACVVLGLYSEKFLTFTFAEIEIIKKHNKEIDKKIQ